jgi:hypothetical protein
MRRLPLILSASFDRRFDMVTNRVRLSTIGGFAIALSSLLGCGNALKPGDYRIYKMEIQEATKSSGCYYPDTAADPNSASDRDTSLATAEWVMTTDTSANYFLDLGDRTLQGKQTPTGIAFAGEKVDVEFEGNDVTKTKRTATVDVTIDVTLDGKSIGGTATTTSSFACSGTSCTTPVPPSCTVTAKFSGTEVDGVEREYPVK